MKQRLLPVFAALLLCTWSVSAFACEHEQKTAAAAKNTAAKAKAMAMTADAKSGCSAEQMAACKSHGASAAHMAACAGKTGAAHAAVNANSGACKAYGASVATASSDGCGGKTATTARVASRMASGGDACCASKGAKTTAHASGVDAVLTGGSACQGSKSAMAKGGHDCDACSELATCDEELGRIGIETQVVPLKNGIMIVYTATAQGKAQAIQNAMARRNGRLNVVTASGERAKLCGECKAIRGAMASGKLTRETVNIGGGVLTVMTSNDPKMVAKLQGLAATKT